MCGIGGFRRFGDQPITRDQIELLMVSLQHRGNDATGIAIMNPGEKTVRVCKGDEPAWNFMKTQTFGKFIEAHLHEDTNIVLVHTRAATKGSPRKLENNHPMYFDKSAVTHNGVVTNDDILFRDLNLTRHAETDSDILRAIVDKEGLNKAVIRKLARCNGSVACAAITPDQPEHLLLVRSGSPLVLAAYNEVLVWASEKQSIHQAMRPWIKKWGLNFQVQTPNIGFLTMADHSAWLFGPKGLEWHDECKTAFHYVEPRRAVWENYNERQDKWNKEDKKVNLVNMITPPSGEKVGRLRVRCDGCSQMVKLTPEQAEKGLENMRCSKCKKPLAIKEN